MLKIDQLKVSYDNKMALNGVTLVFRPNKITGLVGPNGAGKSTLLKTCIGLISSYSGDIFYSDKKIKSNRFWVKQNAVYAPENAELLPYLTGNEFLKMIVKIYNKNISGERIDFFIELLGLIPKKDILINDYSHGMRQKIAVAAALLPDPKFILLDEALNGMDSVSLSRLTAFLRKEAQNDKVIVISSHNVELIQDLCDEVFVINKGIIERYYNKSELEALSKIKDGLLNSYINIIET